MYRLAAAGGLALLLSGSVAAITRADNARIAVAAQAPHILILETSAILMQTHPNPVAANPGGAGPALAAWLAKKKVGILTADEFGAKLAQVLKDRKIGALKASDGAVQAVKGATR